MFPASIPQPSADQYGKRVQGHWPRIALLTTTGASKWTVPDGVTKVRAYAFGSGGSAPGAAATGGGGGCAYGDIDVVPGQVIPIVIATANSGTTQTTFGSWLRGGPASTDGSSNRIGGTAWKDGSVKNGGAYAGGDGVVTASNYGGASSGSPLGVGVSSSIGNQAGCGWGGLGSAFLGGGVGGPAGSTYSGGSGPNGTAAFPGLYTDPLLALCTAPGLASITGSNSGFNGGPGAGGTSSSTAGFVAGKGGLGGGGGSGSSGANGGEGGLGGGGGCGASGNAGGVGGYGGGAGSSSTTTAAGSQGCIIVFY